MSLTKWLLRAMRTGRSDASGSAGGGSDDEADLTDFRLRFGVVASVVDDASATELCCRRVVAVGALCGVTDRLAEKTWCLHRWWRRESVRALQRFRCDRRGALAFTSDGSGREIGLFVFAACFHLLVNVNGSALLLARLLVGTSRCIDGLLTEADAFLWRR